MEKIYLLKKTTKKEGRIRVRFRLRDGRTVDLSHKTDIRATKEELDKFDEYGAVKPKVKLYNVQLEDRITREINLIRDVYREMVDKGYDLDSATLERKIQEKINPVQAARDDGDTLLGLFRDYASNAVQDRIIGEKRYAHIMVVYGKLERYLKIQGRTQITPREFDEKALWDFRSFIIDEYEYVPKYPRLYEGFTPKNLPKERLGMNTAVSQMKMLKTFFSSLDPNQIDRSPFDLLGNERKKLIMRTLYDEPFYLRAEELNAIMETEVPAWLNDTKDAFLLQCAFGCRIGDFRTLTMENVAVSEEGIPYIHYLPSKTKKTQEDNREVVTPIIYYALEIIKRTQLKLKEVRYADGANGFNAKIKAMLKTCGIDRKVPIFNEETGSNEYKPIWEMGSSKLARKTHVDMMTKVQLDPYAAGLHKEGSSAVHRYTGLELKDRFLLMCRAFGQEPYCVDKQLNII